MVEGGNSRTAKRKRKRGFDAYELMSFASTMCVVFPIFGTIRGAPLQPLRSGFSTHHDNPRAPRRQEKCVNHTKTYRQRWPWCRIVVSGHAVSKPNAPGCVCGVLGLAGAQRARCSLQLIGHCGSTHNYSHYIACIACNVMCYWMDGRHLPCRT